jgi:hypothetical protein
MFGLYIDQPAVFRIGLLDNVNDVNNVNDWFAFLYISRPISTTIKGQVLRYGDFHRRLDWLD